MRTITKKPVKRSVENMVVYTDPDFPLTCDNIFTSCGFYKSFSEFEKKNYGMKALVLVPKDCLPKSKRKKTKESK